MASGSNVAAQLTRILTDYGGQEVNFIVDCIRQTTLWTKRQLKARSPGKQYPTEWNARTKVDGLIVTGVVYRGKRAGLAHLLENPHRIVNQYGSYGTTSPGHGQITHIAPVQEEAEEYLLNLLTQGH